MSQYFIYHNPRCSKSRQTLALLQENQIETEQILYLENPPTVDTLSDLCEALGITPRQLLRKGETEYRELSLGNETLGDTEVLKAMQQHPRLIERPIVVRRDGKNVRAVLGRPPENVIDLIK